MQSRLVSDILEYGVNHGLIKETLIKQLMPEAASLILIIETTLR